MLQQILVLIALYLKLLLINMPKKQLNIILILIVLGLWSTIAYKSLNRFFSNDIANNSNPNSNIGFNLKKIKKDTFLLQNLHRDPFLDRTLIEEHNTTGITSSNIVVPKTKIVRPKVITTKPIPVWPSIAYYGYIKSYQKSEELVLVKINNQLEKMRKNQNIDGVTILHVFKDSIEVEFHKQKKYILKN